MMHQPASSSPSTTAASLLAPTQFATFTPPGASSNAVALAAALNPVGGHHVLHHQPQPNQHMHHQHHHHQQQQQQNHHQQNAQLISALSSFPQVQLSNGQLFPVLSNGGAYHHPASHQQLNHQHHLHHQQQTLNLHQAYLAAADPNSLLQSTMSPGAAAASANGLIPPQQRTDRLQVCALFYLFFSHLSLSPKTHSSHLQSVEKKGSTLTAHFTSTSLYTDTKFLKTVKTTYICEEFFCILLYCTKES